MDNVNNNRIINTIINILNQQGYSGIITDTIKYYLDENFLYLFGNDTDVNNFSLFVTGNIIEIKSIFDDSVYQIITETNNLDKRIKCNKIDEGNSIQEFEIKISHNKVTNTINLIYESIYPNLKVKELSYEKNTNKFTLTYKTIIDGVETIDYNSSLQPLNIQLKDKEIFNFNREIPILNTKNTLKKFVDELKGRGNTRIIATDYNPHDIESYSEIIFSELESDASNILNKSFTNKRVHRFF